MWRRHVDHLKKIHNAPASEDGEENSNSANDSWELPSTEHSDTQATESGDVLENLGSADENATADELQNTSETVEAEASSGGSTQRYPTRVRRPPNYFSK